MKYYCRRIFTHTQAKLLLVKSSFLWENETAATAVFN